jgi:hypothetical protein
MIETCCWTDAVMVQIKSATDRWHRRAHAGMSESGWTEMEPFPVPFRSRVESSPPHRVLYVLQLLLTVPGQGIRPRSQPFRSVSGRTRTTVQ